MKLFLKIFAILLLSFNGIGAIYGGLHLMLHPDGSTIELSLAWLKHTPFHNFFIPGVILFIANGLFSVVAVFALLFNYRNYPWLVIAQGAILTGWIIIQMLLIRTVYFLHIILGSIGILLMIIGYLLLQQRRKTSRSEVRVK